MSDSTDPNTEDASGQGPALIADITGAVHEGDTRWLSRTLTQLHPADAADVLEQLSGDDFARAVSLLGGELPSDILIELRDEYREDAVEVLPDEVVATALDELDSDDATAILEDIDEGRRDRILDEIEPGGRAVLELGLTYKEDSAGRLMQREFIAAPEFWTAGKLIDHVRETGADQPEQFYEIYVIDPAHSIKGVVTVAALMRAARDVKLADIMEPLDSDITTDLDQEEVAYQFQKYSLASAPVKDEGGRLVGMITVDDMVEVIQEENTEDLLALSNVTSADGSDTVLDAVKARAPWLGLNLFTAFIASGVISLFEGAIDKIVALAILMPVIAALSGNAGSQGLAVAVRAIAEREMEGKAVRRAILREFLTGVVNGLIFAIGVGLIAFVWFGDYELSGVLAAAMFLAFVWAGLAGVLVPLTLKKLGADPAVASSVFVLTMTDVVSFLSFLGLATLFLL